METLITRDTDILREYIAALDARERALSPFGRLAAVVKLSKLRTELGDLHLETTDEDMTALHREIEERLSRTMLRRFESRPIGARVVIFLLMILGAQLALATVYLITALFTRLAPVPSWWNPLLPHDEPVLLYIFIFTFFAIPPFLALSVLFGGRYFKSWRITVPATFGIILLSVLGVYLSVRGKPNPALRSSSVSQLARERGVDERSYREWVSGNWLFKDPKFQKDYENYLRNGPGRWISAREDAKDDASWRDSLKWISEYLETGQDPTGFRDWLKYYLERSRIYSEERVDSAADLLTTGADPRFLGIWKVEPYLKERDERMYRAHLGSINHSMKKWGLIALGVYTLAFLFGFVINRLLPRIGGRSPIRPALAEPGSLESGGYGSRKYAFPEIGEIVSPSFFETPFKLLERVHGSFVGLAISTIVITFLFWGVWYAFSYSSGHENAPSQSALMASYLIGGGRADDDVRSRTDLAAAQSDDATAAGSVTRNMDITGAANLASGNPSRSAIEVRIAALQQVLDDSDYDNSKKFKQQSKLIAQQNNQIDLLKNLTSQLQQGTSALPQQITDLGARASAIEDRAGQAANQANAVKAQADDIDKRLTGRLGEVDSRATHAAEEAAKAGESASSLTTRTDALEKELDRRAHQIEARTEELGERTATLNDREATLDRIQHAMLTSILSEIAGEVDALDQHTRSSFYRLLNKTEARRQIADLTARIQKFKADLEPLGNDDAKKQIAELTELETKVEHIAARFK